MSVLSSPRVRSSIALALLLVLLLPIVASPATAQDDPTYTGPLVSDSRVASRVLDADGCPADTVETVRSSDTRIYMSYLVKNVAAGDSFGIQVSQNGAVIYTDLDFATANQAYDRVCVWYRLDTDVFDFEVADYSVALLDGAGEVVPFFRELRFSIDS